MERILTISTSSMIFAKSTGEMFLRKGKQDDVIFDQVIVTTEAYNFLSKAKKEKLMTHLKKMFPKADVKVAEVINYTW